MSDEANSLGEYLRARRELVTPEDVGLPQFGIRRVPGLRREEVAMLAGISADYYLRLEQGRDRNPSVQVLESIARVLQLDDAGTAYLISLGADKPFAEGRYFDVLAVNRLATALSPRLTVGRNRLRDVFLDPAEQALFPSWEQATANLVAGFRESVGTDTDDPRFIELVGELSLGSERFRKLWARHDVLPRESGPVTLDHPQVGRLSLYREKLAVTGASGQMLAIYHAEPGTADAEKLGLLASFQGEVNSPSRRSEDSGASR
jgi:transcriptional regulator with XRE-family HTH domain